MIASRKPLLWAAAAIAGGIVLVLAIRGLGGDTPAPAPAVPAPVAPIADEPALEAAPALPHTAERAPWELGQPAAPSRATAATAASLSGRVPAQTMSPAEAAASIATIRQQSQRNVAMVDQLLVELDDLEKSGQAPPGMEFNALRGNLAIAKRAQVLALELAESSQLPDTPARRQRTGEIVAELQQLQGQLRYDVTPAGLPGTARTQ